MTREIRNVYGWRKVEAPKPWYPKVVGEEICGYYGGRTMRNGKWGQYEVIIVHIPKRGALLVSGTMAIQLIDAAGIDVGAPIRVVWQGYKPIEGRDFELKMFDVYVQDEEACPVAMLPSLTGEHGQPGQHGS